MDRNALLLYLRDVRDLELVKRNIENAHEREKNNFFNQKSRLSTPDLVREPERTRHIGAIILSTFGTLLGAVMLLGSILYIFSKDSFWRIVMIVFSAILLICGLIILIAVMLDSSKNKKEVQKSIDHNKHEYERVRNNQKAIADLEVKFQKRHEELNANFQKVCGLLFRYYSMNILPNPYRNLAAVYYIYDYMSSSGASFEGTLLHEHMEDGVRRILNKLDQIIVQIQDLEFNMRRLEAQNCDIINKNKQMLQSLHEMQIEQREHNKYIEDNSDYIRMQTNYLATTEFFRSFGRY